MRLPSTRTAGVNPSVPRAFALRVCALVWATLGMVSLLATSAVQAADFRSVGVAAAVLFDSPSAKGKKLFVAPRGMPLEVLSVVNNWVKVRDSAGDVLWIERAELANQRTVVAMSTAMVRSSPQDSATIVFQAERGVLLDLSEPAPASGWAKVKHRDGSLGFVKATEVWGL
jgi:SH3-like domain-containing protein